MGMSVPTYDSPQVQEQALPGARQSSIVSPDMLNAGAERTMQQGAALQDAGAMLNRAAIRMKHEDDLRTVQEATAKYQKASQDYVLSAKRDRTGDSAQGLVGDFDKFHKDTVADISKGLKNPEQQRAFGVMTGRSGMAVRHDLGGFELGERRKATDASFDALVTNTINAGAIAAMPSGEYDAKNDPAMVQRDLLVNSARAYAAQRNMNGDQEKALTSNVLTKFHAQRIQQLVSDPSTQTQAETYFKAHKDEIAGSQQAEIGALATKATATATGDGAAQDAWQRFAPQTAKDPVKTFDMQKHIRETLKGNEPAIKAAMSGLNDRVTAYEHQRKEESFGAQAAVIDLINKGASPAQLRRSPEYLNLLSTNSESAMRVMEHAEGQVRSAEQTAAARESRADSAEARAERKKTRDGYAAYFDYSNADKLSNMSENEIKSLQPTLGNQLTNTLLEKKRSLRDPGALKEVATLENQLSNAHDLMKWGHSDADKKGLFDTVVQQEMSAAQKQKGKPLTYEERQKIIDRNLIQGEVPGRVWGTNTKRGYEVQGTEDAAKFVPTIPTADLDMIKAALKRAGRKEDPAEIMRLYKGEKGLK